MFFKSIRFSLTLWYSVTLAVILLLFSSFIYLTIRKQMYAEADRELLTITEAVASPTLDPFRNSAPSVFDQVLEDFIGPKVADKFVQVLDSKGEPIAHSRNLEDIRLQASPYVLSRARLGKLTYTTMKAAGLHPVRCLTYPIMTNGKLTQTVQVAVSLEGATDTLERLLLIFAISIPLSLLLLGYGGWFLAGRALKPVDLITRSAKKITAENLSHRLEVVNPNDEIGRLAETFNMTLARLENSFRRTRQFSADVSHELRTPLTILQGETEVGIKWVKEPDEFRELLQSNLDEIKRMSNIIEALLELSRMEEGGVKLELQEIGLRALFEELVQQRSILVREKELHIRLEAAKELYVWGDWLRLRQVFANLIDNAIKYTPEGGAITLTLEEVDARVRVEVTDTGPGIPAEDIPFIFDRFYRVDKARNRAHGGSGLGLSLAKTFTEAHGGRIEVVSKVGSGSTFIVHLPLFTPSS